MTRRPRDLFGDSPGVKTPTWRLPLAAEPELVDLSGRKLEFMYRSGFPFQGEFVERGQTVGQLWTPSNHKPYFLAELAGCRWKLKTSGTENRFGISFIGDEDPILSARGRTWIVDGIFSYQLVQTGFSDNPSGSVRADGQGELVTVQEHHRDRVGPRLRVTLTVRSSDYVEHLPMLVLGATLSVAWGMAFMIPESS